MLNSVYLFGIQLRFIIPFQLSADKCRYDQLANYVFKQTIELITSCKYLISLCCNVDTLCPMNWR